MEDDIIAFTYNPETDDLAAKRLEYRQRRGRIKCFVDDVTGQCRWRISSVRDWVRCRTTRRRHIIKTGLKPGYYDEDTLILHGSMALLERYVDWHGGEQELETFTNELREKDGESRQVHTQSEALAIYQWWKNYHLYAKREADLYDAVPSTGNYPDRYKAVNDFEEQRLADEQAMLRRLIEIRPGLWT